MTDRENPSEFDVQVPFQTYLDPLVCSSGNHVRFNLNFLSKSGSPCPWFVAQFLLSIRSEWTVAARVLTTNLDTWISFCDMKFTHSLFHFPDAFPLFSSSLFLRLVSFSSQTRCTIFSDLRFYFSIHFNYSEQEIIQH